MGQLSSREEEAAEHREGEEGKGRGLFGWLFSPKAGDKRTRDHVDEPGLDLPVAKKRAKEQSSLDGNSDKQVCIPKAPMQSYLAFSVERRPQLRREHPNATNGEVSVMLGEEWRASAELREKYKVRQGKLKAEYQARMAELGLQIPKRTRTVKKSKQKRDDGRPKPPKRAFYLYAKEYRPILKKENPDASAKEISEILSKRWSETSEEFRTKYLTEYGKLLEIYREEMATWREKQSQEVDEAKQEVLGQGMGVAAKKG